MTEVPAFLLAVKDLSDWVDTVPMDQRYGEWECNYPRWGLVYSTWEELVADKMSSNWTLPITNEVLFAIARDNESEVLIHALRTKDFSELVLLAKRCVASEEADAKWQIAQELQFGEIEIVEPILIELAKDQNEYVRRKSIQSLARLQSPQVETLAIAEWNSAKDTMPWTRMNVLWVLMTIKSEQLEPLLQTALQSVNLYLRSYALRIRNGEISDIP